MSNRLFLILACLAIAAGLAYETLTYSSGNEGDLTIAHLGNGRVELNGSLGDQSFRQMKAYVRKHPETQTLVLGSMSGTTDLDNTIALSRWVRQQGLNTELASDSWIASGAVDLFISGQERFIECGAMIGVHAWSYRVGLSGNQLSSPNDYRHKAQIGFFDDMGLKGHDFYWFTMKSADADDLHFMTPEEINRFGLSTAGRVC